MKFDAVIGNPPYQESNGGGTGSGAKSLYEQFIMSAMRLGSNIICMITKSSWFNGNGYKDFRDKFVEGNHITKIVDYTNADEVFSGMGGIAGGVSYFTWDRNYNSKCLIENHTKGKVSSAEIFLNASEIIRYPELNTMVEKIVKRNNFKNMTHCISGQTPFGFNTNALDDTSVLCTDYFNIKLVGSRGREGWISKDEITKHLEWLPYYKVLINQAMSGGCKTDANGMTQVLSKPFSIKPNEVCTQTYLVAGICHNIDTCINIEKYLSTKFLRVLMWSTLTSISINPDTFRFVPLQDFSSASDIDWSQPISQIDQQLYKKYGLSPEEIDYIEKTIKPMEF